MGRVTGSWERPIQGVSQQSDKDRIDGQCTLQENLTPSPLYGLIKRIGTRHIKKLIASAHKDSLWHVYSRGDGEAYIMLIEPNTYPKVFDLMGVQRMVSNGNPSAPYLQVSNPKSDLRMTTVADYTFILNTKRVTSKDSVRTPTNPNTAIIYCQYATYGRDYQIKDNGVTIATYTTPDGSTSSHINQVKTNYVIAQLKVAIDANSGYTATVQGNTLFLTRIAAGTMNATTVDSADGNDLVAIQGRVKTLQNLPPYAPTDYVVKVQNSEGFDSNAYWLKAVKGGVNNKVTWEESPEPSTFYRFIEDALPHTLVSEADGTFTLDKAPWEERRVGNEETNPFPSFVGSKLTSVGVFQNRLFLTSGESVIFSRTSNFFDFFRETTQTTADSDPVDAFADADEINNLKHHAVLDGDIIFFADNGQFLIKGDKPITKEGLIFKKVTSYPINTKAKPAVTGESVMFSFISGRYAGIREMFTDSFTDTKRARPITEHVAEYIEGVPVDMVASPNINTLLLRTDVSNKEVYVYDWLWSGDQKVQSAMHKWIFGGDVLFAKFIEDKVFFVIDRGDGIYLEDMPIGNDIDDEGLDFPVRLDQRVAVTATWNTTEDRWDFDVPYIPSDPTKLRVVRGAGCWEADKGTGVIYGQGGGSYWTTDDLADTSTTTTVTLIIGTTFTSKYIPTRPFLKDQNGRTMGLDRFTLGKFTLHYESIGVAAVKVKDRQSQREWEYPVSSRRMGGFSNKIGFAPLVEGSMQFPVRLQSNLAQFEITTDDYIPFVLRYMEWEGLFRQRGRRI